MTGKQIIIAFLLKKNIQYVFHLPGIHTLPLNAHLAKHVKDFTTIVPRHESNLAFMADGYARTSGKPAVIIVTPGPGIGNIVTGCMEAFHCDVPLLVIHIDVERKNVSKGILHGVLEPETIFRNITKRTCVVSDTRELAHTLDSAYALCTDARKGPVLVSIPYTSFEKDVPQDGVPSPAQPREHGEAGETGLSRFFVDLEQLLGAKKRPVIIAGSSAMSAEAGYLLHEICETAAVPFLTTTGGKGVLPENSGYTFGNIMSRRARDIVAAADLVIAVGTRLRDVEARRRSVKIGELVHIDVDDKFINRNYVSRLSFAGNLVRALRGIETITKEMKFEWNLQALAEAHKGEFLSLQKSPAYRLMNLLRQAVPEGTTVVCDLNIVSYWCEYYFPVLRQNSFIMPRGISPIFYALPASIGAKLGRPDFPCLAICGDGGALPTVAELSTIQQYNIPVVIFLYNNNGFGILEDIMVDRYNTEGVMGLRNPDFIRLARSFDIKAKRTDKMRSLKKIFEHDISWNEPFLIEFTGPIYPPPWKIESPRTVVSE